MFAVTLMQNHKNYLFAIEGAIFYIAKYRRKRAMVHTLLEKITRFFMEQKESRQTQIKFWHKFFSGIFVRYSD